MRRAARTYVHARMTASRFTRASSPRTRIPASPSLNIAPDYYTTNFRYTTPPNIQDLTLALEVPNFGLWVNELWHDFLVEPTPYLVASAICYVGGVLVLVQYYWAIWWLACFVFRLLPWDDDLGFI